MRFEIKTVNNGPFRMYQVIDNTQNPPMVIATTSDADEAKQLQEVQQWDWENRDN